MAPPQVITGFNDNSQIDFFKCCLLQEKVEKLRRDFPDDPTKAHSREKIYSAKRSLRMVEYESYRNSLTLKMAEDFAGARGFRLRIWKQIDRKKPLYLEYEGKPESDAGRKFRDLDIFSRNFDTFKNQDFSNLSLILDIEKFLKSKKFDPTHTKPMFRQMTLFQAVVTELFPKLHGPSFNAKVKNFEAKWGEKSFHLNDAKRLYDLFGLGIQIWTKIEKPNRHYEIRKVWDTLYAKKLRIRMKDFDLNDRFPLTDTIEYIYDEVAINYFSCPNKNCLFGTPRRDRLERHVRSCRTETVTRYDQKKFQKSSNKVREQLAAEGILPDINYQNTMFCTYDIGNYSLK